MRLAFVTPRYGADIASGPEHACRLLAEQIGRRHDVEVLTTCARRTGAWTNETAEGADRVRGVLVRRFAVAGGYDARTLRDLSARLRAGGRPRSEEIEWVTRRGPVSPGLVDFVRRQHRGYDALVFFGLQYATTVQALPIAGERAALFPYLQLTPELRFGLWPELLRTAAATGWISTAERRLAREYLGLQPLRDEVVGVGIEAPARRSYPRHQQDPADTLAADDDTAEPQRSAGADTYLAGRGVLFRRRHRLYGDFALYGGRVESDNGCEEMLEYFDAYAGSAADASLVLMGVKMIKVPDAPYLRFAGVLPDGERMAAFEAATVTLAPEPHELLARPVLESLAVGTPVLVNAANEAGVEHCRSAGAGLYYENREEFVEALRLLMGDSSLRDRLGRNGQAYVKRHFHWEAVLGRFERLLSRARVR